MDIDNQTVLVGSNVTFKCEAMSDSMPHFQWLRWSPVEGNTRLNTSFEIISQENEEIPKPESSDRFAFHGIDLNLINVSTKDSGRYTCVVGNAVGYAVKHTFLGVNEKIGKSPGSQPGDFKLIIKNIYKKGSLGGADVHEFSRGY